jgi:hypothetical protein
MIIKQNTGEKIGKVIPDAFVTSFLINKASDSDTNYSVKLNLRDKINEINNFTWLENKQLTDNLKIKILTITDETLYNGLISSASITSSYISDISSESDNLKIETIYANKFLTNYKNYKNILLPSNENGDKFVYIDIENKHKNSIKSRFVGTFIYSYLDLQDKKIIGALRSDIILKDDIVPEALYYVDPVNNTILDRIDNDEQYLKNNITNFKVKDLRNFNILKDEMSIISGSAIIDSNILDSSIDISDLHVSYTPSKKIVGGFYINLDTLLTKYSTLYKFFKDTKRENILKQLRGYSRIKSLKIYRKKILESESKINEPEIILINSKDNLENKILISAVNQNFSIKEITNFSENNICRYFNFTDTQISDITDGKYKYIVQLSLLDGSAKYINENISNNLQNIKKTFQRYLNMFEIYKKNTSKIYEEFKNNYEDDVSKSILEFSRIFIVFNKNLTQDAVIKNLSKMLHPLSAEASDIQKIINIVDDVDLMSQRLLNSVQRESRSILDTREQKSTNKEILSIKKMFNNFTYDSSWYPKTGIEYTSYLPLDSRSEPIASSFSKIREAIWRSRKDREIRKYYKQATSDTSISLSRTAEMPFAEYLSGVPLNSGSFPSVLSPAYIDILGKSYDLVNHSYDISQNIHTKITLEVENLLKNKFLSRENIPAASFYSLNNIGLLANSLNTEKRSEDTSTETNILYDQNPETSKNSKNIASFYKIDKLFSIMMAYKHSSTEYFKAFDYSSDKFIVKNMLDANQTAEFIKNYLIYLPLQLKSAIFSNIQQYEQSIFAFNEQIQNSLFYNRYNIDYCLLKRVEYLKSPVLLKTISKNNKNIIVQEKEIWSNLTDSVIKDAKNAKKLKYLVCRLKDYINNDFINPNIKKDYELPIYNEYFLYDLEQDITIEDSEEQSEKKLISIFKNYNVRPEMLKFVEILDKKSVFKEEIKKLIELI